MDPELKHFLKDQDRFSRGLGPAPNEPCKHIQPRQVHFIPGNALTPGEGVTRAQKKLARDRQRMAEHLRTKFGTSYHPSPSPVDSAPDLFRRQPQLCSECNNASVNHALLPPEKGCFIIDSGSLRRGCHKGIRWVCASCILEHKMATQMSPGERTLAAGLRDAGIEFQYQYWLRGRAYDFYIERWHLLVEVDSWSAHHTAAQKKKDFWRDKIAREQGYRLYRVRWNDRCLVEKVKTFGNTGGR